MKNIEELRGLAVIEGKDLATYEYELLKDLYEENQEQKRVLDKIKLNIEQNVIRLKNGKLLVELNVNELYKLLEEKDD